MIPASDIFLKNICYTPLVFERFNKKLGTKLDNDEIKQLVNKIISDPRTTIIKQGKNYYLKNKDIELFINSYNYRLITANKN